MRFQLRKTEEKDIRAVMNIIKQAQQYFKERNIDQWQNGYPNELIIKEDIKREWSYILADGDNVVATAAISFEGEPTYDEIYEGRWLSNEKYAVIHRICVNNEFKGIGLASQILDSAERLCVERNVHSIKIDTHKENVSMQKSLVKKGYKYCGIIYLEDKSERIAFEKLF